MKKSRWAGFLRMSDGRTLPRRLRKSLAVAFVNFLCSSVTLGSSMYWEIARPYIDSFLKSKLVKWIFLTKCLVITVQLSSWICFLMFSSFI